MSSTSTSRLTHVRSREWVGLASSSSDEAASRVESALVSIKGIPHAVLDVVIAQLHNDPSFARKMAEALEQPQPSLRPQRSAGTTATPDPYEVVAQGVEAVRSQLAKYDAPILRKLIKLHRLDLGGETKGWRNTMRLAAYIAERVEARYRQGQVIR